MDGIWDRIEWGKVTPPGAVTIDSLPLRRVDLVLSVSRCADLGAELNFLELWRR